ncbi:hypothetical protein AB669_01170 [Pedobacter sp. BMA]|nr:hypothetical protein AB669_01170 [Pedobacter sp. BMA]
MIGFSTVFAQKPIRGTVKDHKGISIESVNVNLKDIEGNIIAFTRTNKNGEFGLPFKNEQLKGYKIEVSSIGYQKQSVAVTQLDKAYDFTLSGSETILETVTVRNSPLLKVNGDTLNYRTSDFADQQDRSIGDVIKKMPGVEISENGKISYNGKPISNLYVDGDNLLDDKYNIATKSVPHGAVEKVQVIQNDQPVKMLRKNNMSDDVALNLVIKDDAKMKVMGDATAGVGTPDRFDENLTAMLFNKKLKFINNVKANNTGNDPGIDLTSHNMEDYTRRLDNSKPAKLLSTGAAGVPSLPQSRYLVNTAALLNLNNLYKFNQDLQLRANISYIYDNRRQQYSKFSQTYLAGQTVSYSEFQNNEINPQRLRAHFNLNKNADADYLNNNLVLDYSPFKTVSDFSINNIAASQTLRQHGFDLSNELNYRKKLKSSQVINLYSYLNRSTQSESLDISPGLNADILNSGNPYRGLKQYIKLPTWYFNNYASLAFVSGGFTQTYKTGFNIQQQNLDTELYRIQNNQSIMPSENAINSLDWFKQRIYADASYEFTNEKIKAGVSVPMSYNHIAYRDQVNGLDNKLNKVFVNPSVNVKYQTGIENYITANYFYKNDLGSLDDIYRGTVLKNYRSLFANNAPISETKTHSLGGVFNFRKAMQMFFFNAGANYSDTELNTISSYTLTNNIQQRIVLPFKNHIKNLSFNANLSKYLFLLKTTANAGISISESRYNQLQNGERLPFRSNTVAYKAGFEARLAGFMNWSYNASYSVTQNRAEIPDAITTNFQQLRQQSSLAVTLMSNVYLNLSAEHLFTHQSSQRNLNYLFADVNVKYRFSKLKTDLEFGLTNLANIKQYDAIYLSANSLTTGTYLIPGRVAMLKATFNF